jgi:hypothetical protein
VTEPTAHEAINAYLTPVEDADDGRFSLLDAVLSDANKAMEADALWLGASGYLISIEQLGKTVEKMEDPAARGGSEDSFRAALADFAPGLEEDTAGALYGLRCSLVHSFGLINEKPGTDKHRVFALTRSGPPVKFPETDWDGTIEGTKSLEMTTVVNIEGLRDLAERCVTQARALNDTGELNLVPDMSPERLFAERIMRVVPESQVYTLPTYPSTGASVTGTP